jgi:predicted nucleotidyltransferase
MNPQPASVDPVTARAIQAFVNGIAHYAIAGVLLYGSRARGDHDEYSDADLAVFLKGERHAKADLIRTKLEMADIAFDVLLDTNVLVSPMPIWEDEWQHPETYSNPRLLENIRREGVWL